MFKIRRNLKKLKKSIRNNIYRPLNRLVIKHNPFSEIDFEKLLHKTQLLNFKTWFQTKIKNNSEFIFNYGILFLLSVYYFPFFKYLNYEIANYFKAVNLLLMDGLIVYFLKYAYRQTIFILILYTLIERYIYNINLKKNVKATYSDRFKYTPQIFERIFVFLNYFGLWVVLSGGQLKLTSRLLIKIFPKNYYRACFFDGILLKCLFACTKIPGYTKGITSYISLYATYLLIIRNNKVFPYFIRYHFMAAQLSAILVDLLYTISIFFLKYYIYINHKHHRRYKFLLNYIIYIVHSIYIFYSMILSFMGFLIPINFINSAIFWHVGIDKRI